MSRRRDDARRNARREFATTRPDGTPVGSFSVTYQDLCVLHYRDDGMVRSVCFGGEVGGPDHEPGSHTPENWLMRGRYRFDDDLDDYYSAEATP